MAANVGRSNRKVLSETQVVKPVLPEEAETLFQEGMSLWEGTPNPRGTGDVDSGQSD
jgi:hypothetical protein